MQRGAGPKFRRGRGRQRPRQQQAACRSAADRLQIGNRPAADRLQGDVAGRDRL